MQTYPTILVLVIGLAIWNWLRQEERIRALDEQRADIHAELLSQAEGEVERMRCLDETMKTLRRSNAELELQVQDQMVHFRESERELEHARAENKVLCMKLAQAVWRNGHPDAPLRGASGQDAAETKGAGAYES